MLISDWSSDVCSSDLTDMPLICDVILLAMARPAASSLALLMRLPVDRRSSDAASDISALFEALAERIADTLVPIIVRSEEHTSELQSLMRISYAVFCLKKKNHT